MSDLASAFNVNLVRRFRKQAVFEFKAAEQSHAICAMFGCCMLLEHVCSDQHMLNQG